MKLPAVLLLCLVQGAIAQVRTDSVPKQSSDSSWNVGQYQLHRWQSSHPRVESDGVVIGNTKYFIMIWRTDPSIDPGIIVPIPDSLDIHRVPDPRFNVPGRPHSLGTNIDHMPESTFNIPGRPLPDTRQHVRYK